MLSKAEELKILEATIEKLGPDSYLGPALEELLPFVASSIRSDLQPDLLGSLELMKANLSRLADQRILYSAELRDMEASIKSKTADVARLNLEIRAAKCTADELGRHLVALSR